MQELVASMESALYPVVVSINTYLSNYILVFLLIGVGLWYSIKTRFVQVRCFGAVSYTHLDVYKRQALPVSVRSDGGEAAGRVLPCL